MSDDLSHYHRPVGDTFPTVGSPESMADLRLSEGRLEGYAGDGFVAGVRVLDDNQVKVLGRELAELMDPVHEGNALFHEFHSNESGDPDQVLFHALGAWRISPAFHDLLWNSAVLVPAAQLLGGPVRFWHDQLFCKPPSKGGVVAWHQDFSYWTRTAPMAHLTCWIGLDDSTVENGCLQYVPGSHRWDLLPITGLAGEMDSIGAILTADQKAAFNPVPIELRAGQCSFHHPLTVHGSFANRSDRSRRGVVLNFVRDGVRSLTDDPLLEGIAPIEKGRPLDGQFFPLLFTSS